MAFYTTEPIFLLAKTGVKLNTMWNHNMAVLFLMTVLLSQCSAQNLKIDIGDTVRQHDLNKGTAEFQAPVALQWGIADTSTNVGKIFKFAIPSDAFRGTIQSVKVSTINQVIVCVCVFCLCLYSDEQCILADTTGLLAHIKKHWLHVGILPQPPSNKISFWKECLSQFSMNL